MVLLLAAGCATTEQVAVKDQPAVCGFLGADVCQQLKPGEKGEAGLRWVNPKVQLTRYEGVDNIKPIVSRDRRP